MSGKWIGEWKNNGYEEDTDTTTRIAIDAGRVCDGNH